ncbi:hypothetical protein PENSPDRAFT_758357 [Peniophora sp. CONT]|nr:hypothetical protein PENSPDRAFT_758357 [Peniophora sp. CONT]
MAMHLPTLPTNVPPKGLLFGTFLQVSGQACEYCLHAPARREKFERCSKCRRVYYCNEVCQDQDWDTHKKLCEGLRRVNAAEASEALPNGKLTPEEYGDRMKTRMAILTETEPQQDPIYVQNAVKCEACLLTPFQKDEFSTFHRCKRCKLACYFEHHFPQYDTWTTNGAAEFGAGNKDPKAAVTALTKEALVFPLTIATALETALPDVSSRTSLVIHVVGADTRELLSQATLENILHCYPRLRSLTLCFIGPNADPHYYPRNVACGECLSKGRHREVLYAPVKYHECPWAPCKEHPSRPNAPDLIVCFNTGMLESDAATESWAETVQLILDADVPALFTTTTRADVIMEVGKFRAERAQFVLKARKNKWHGPLHLPNVYRAEKLMEGGPQTTAYNSHYMYTVQGRVDS